MTEDEAKTKLCCGPILGSATALAIAQGSGAGATAKCAASACMAWRWSEAKRTLAFLEAVQVDMKKSAKPNFNASVAAVYADKGSQFARTEGFCGLAGAEGA